MKTDSRRFLWRQSLPEQDTGRVLHDNHSRARLFVTATSLLMIVIGLLTEIGWIFDINIFKSVLVGAATMKPNTALCFILAGITLWSWCVSSTVPHTKVLRVVGIIFPILILAIAMATLYEYLFGKNFGVDVFLFPRITMDVHDLHPGRMAPATAAVFVVFVLAIYNLRSTRPINQLLGQISAWVVLLIGLLALLGYAYGMEDLYRMYSFSSMALHTALLSFMGGFGLLFTRTDLGLARIVTSPYSGGRIARQILPLAVLTPFLIGFLRLWGQHAGLYGTEFGVAMFACITVSIFILLVSYSARAVNTVDAKNVRSQQALQQSAQRFRSVLETIHLIGIILDRRGDIILCNDYLLKLTGWTREQVLHKNWFEIFVPHEIRESIKEEVFLTAMQSGQINPRIEHEILTRENERRLIAWNNIVLRDPEGRIDGAASIGEDITVRQLMEQNLRDSEARLQAIHQQLLAFITFAPVSIAMFDKDMRYLAVSQRWTQEFGRGYTNLIGRSHYDVHPDLPEVWKQAHQRSLAGETLSNDDDEWIQADGSIHWLRWSITPWYKTPGSIAGIIITTEDITARRKAEAALRASEEHFRTLFEQATDGILVTNAQGRFVDANSAVCRQFGYSRDEFLNLSLPDIITPDDMQRLSPEIARLENGNVARSEWHVRRKDGSVFIAEVAAKQLPNGNLQGILRDVTDVRKTLVDLNESEERLRLALEAAHMGTFDVDMTTMRLHWSRGHEELWGYKPGEFDGSFAAFAARVHPDDLPVIQAQIDHCTESRESFTQEFRVVWPDNSIHWIASLGEFTYGEGHQPQRMHGVAIEVTERKHNEARLNYLANHDALTGLPNRTLFYDRLQQALIDADRNHRLVAVVFLDLDRFKNINDSLGHEIGDELLRSVSERLLGAVRRGDTVARLGGDEYTLILAGISQIDEAARIAQKILDVFTQPFHLAERELFVGASLGVTICPIDSRNIGELLRFADIAMYRAKELGRNNFQFYASEMTIKATDTLTLEHELRRGFENNEFLLHYQPIVDRQGKCIGAEALLRWQHSQPGLMSPEEFIPLAEETGLILPLGDWVAHEACDQAQAWRRLTDEVFHIAINVSPRQFRQPGLEQSIETILRDTGLDHHALNIEITEGMLMQQEVQSQEMLRRLGDQGITFSIDDFGTGYSNLSYLKRFPISYLKIDQTFIRDVTTDPNDAALVKAIISMAHSLGMQTIAEGVETVEQHGFLIENECDAMQGYYYCKPQPARVISDFLAARMQGSNNLPAWMDTVEF